MNTNTRLARLTNDSLLIEVKRAAADERRAIVQLVALLGEVDARRLYLAEGCASLYTYCTQVLHLSEDAAYFRMETARAARAYPVILRMLAEGALTPTVVRLLRPHLTPDNHRQLLEAARDKTKREVEDLVARLRPQPAVPSSVRKLPCAKPAPAPALLPERSTESETHLVGNERKGVPGSIPDVPGSKPAVVKPLAPERYKVQFTISAETHAKLRQVQDLLRHRVPNGDPGKIFDQALTLLLEHLQRTKLAAARRPRQQQSAPSRSRHIPASVRREVWARDGGRCAFFGTEGRCTETGFLEFHHVEPYAVGGTATAQNIQLRCRAHNVYEADLFFGGGESGMVRESRTEYRARRDSVQNEFPNSTINPAMYQRTPVLVPSATYFYRKILRLDVRHPSWQALALYCSHGCTTCPDDGGSHDYRRRRSGCRGWSFGTGCA